MKNARLLYKKKENEEYTEKVNEGSCGQNLVTRE